MDFRPVPGPAGIVAIALWVLLLLGAVFMIWDPESHGLVAKLVFGVVILAAVVLLKFALSALLTSTHLVLHSDRIEVVRRICGFRRPPQVIFRGQIQQIEVVKAFSVNHQPFFRLVIHTQGGQRISVPAYIRGKLRPKLFAIMFIPAHCRHDWRRFRRFVCPSHGSVPIVSFDLAADRSRVSGF